MQRSVTTRAAAVVATVGMVLAACGSDEDDAAGDEEPPAADDPGPATTTSEAEAADDDADIPTIVVTTNILGDVVEEVVGDAAEVVTIMPVGADPHDFQASAQEVDVMMNADALIVNGAAFEEGLLDVIENAGADGIPTFEAISVVETIEFGEGGHDHGDEDHEDHEDHGDEDHGDEEHTEDAHDDHDHSGADPHFFTDPMRMAAAVEGIAGFLQDEIDVADPAALGESADAYVSELTALDVETEEMLASIPEERRVLVTNHDVFGYFADRYGFEVVGVVIPGGGTTGSASAGELAELAEVIDAEGVPAIFSDNSASDELSLTLAEEVGDIAVVELYTGSLGEPGSDGETYVGMMRSNAERITDALA